jgi:hypothetical protein
MSDIPQCSGVAVLLLLRGNGVTAEDRWRVLLRGIGGRRLRLRQLRRAKARCDVIRR